MCYKMAKRKCNQVTVNGKSTCEQVSAVNKIFCTARKGCCGDMQSLQGW